MQALFLFALYGMFYAVIMAVMASGGNSAQELKVLHVQGTQDYFKNFENLINQQIIPQDLRIPNLGSTVTPYLEQPDVKQKLNWNLGDDTTTDPWGTPFTGFVAHQNIAIRGQQGGGQVQLPVTAFVLISAGPDLKIDSTLQSRLNSLRSSSQLRELLNLEETPGSDDIVHTFSTQQALNERWEMVEIRVREIANTVARQYKTNYQNFLRRLEAFYGSNYVTFFNTAGELNYTTANINRWRADGIINATHSLPDMINYENEANIGSQGAFNFIEGDTNLLIRLKAYRSTGSIGNAQCRSATPQTNADTLRICVTNNGSPWGDSAGQLFYYQDVKGEQL